MAPSRDTPAMRQYDAFKKRHPDCVLFFRMGDFYEMFDEDARTAHKALGITLTQRTEGVPMAGVPYHAVESYLRRMIAQGFRVAVCDQVQDPREAKGIVERAVTRVLTPGTLVDDSLLDESAPNNLAGVCFLDPGDDPMGRVGVGVVELSTGAFCVFDCLAGSLADELARRSVSEVLYAEPAPQASASAGAPPRVKRLLDALGVPGTPRPSWHFRASEAHDALLEHYAVASLAGFGLAPDDPGVPAAGAIIRYLRETQALDTAGMATSDGHSSGSAGAFMLRPRSIAHIAPPKREDPRGFLLLDAAALRALEIERTIRRPGAGPGASRDPRARRSPVADADGSLLGIFSTAPTACRTSMGRRLLREWLCRPLAVRPEIEARHACVATLVADPLTATALTDAIDGVQDVARITARVGLARATPRDLAALGRSLARLDAVAGALENAPAFGPHRAALAEVRASLAPIAHEIARACVDEPPAHLREGGLIRDGVDAALDECRALQHESGRWLAEYQQRLVTQHELPSLKVGFNRVFGYYIELPAAQARRAPAQFTRKQTLKNAERYITPELKDYENKVLGAEERALQREQELFAALCARASTEAPAIARFGQTVAELDVLACFAARAAHKGWRRPAMVDEPILDIRQGRHPVLEELLGHEFVPNDCRLGTDGATGAPCAEGDASDPAAPASGRGPAPHLALITGPNMAGKSTFIRQVALIALLAHAGSFVPAEDATIGLVDRVFTRIGADDALHAGQSTFMVEMVEAAGILHHATGRSLVILDEIGRGTSTLDGLALAWAIAERLALPTRSGAPRTLFATHYHELTDLAERLPKRVMNLQVAVREWGDDVVFLHRILPGRASRSYGIHVAKLAGLPPEVVARANALLESLSVSHSSPGVGAHSEDRAAGRPGDLPAPHPPAAAQLPLFTEYLDHPALAELRELKLESLSPLEAFDELRRLQQQAHRNQTAS